MEGQLRQTSCGGGAQKVKLRAVWCRMRFTFTCLVEISKQVLINWQNNFQRTTQWVRCD